MKNICIGFLTFQSQEKMWFLSAFLPYRTDFKAMDGGKGPVSAQPPLPPPPSRPQRAGVSTVQPAGERTGLLARVTPL